MTTSVLLHRRPDLVHMDKVPNQKPVIYPAYDIFPVDPSQGTQTGILASATGATPQKGEILFQEYVEKISAAAREAFGLA
jgi:creatinine amidohydrolase